MKYFPIGCGKTLLGVIASEALYLAWCRAKRSNLIHNKIKHFEIAASLTLLAMTARIEFFRKLLGDP